VVSSSAWAHLVMQRNIIMSAQENNYSFGRAARTATTLGMAGLVVLGGAAMGAPAMAASGSAQAGGEATVSAGVSGKQLRHSKVRFHSTNAQPDKGQAVRFKGKVTKNHHRHVRVLIQKERANGHWKRIGKTFTNRHGHFHATKAFNKDVTVRAKSQGRHVSRLVQITINQPTPPPPATPTDPSQVQVPAGDTVALLKAIDAAPNGATLHLSGTYNVSNSGHETINGDDRYSGIVVNKALTLDGGWLQSDGSSNVIDVGPQGNLNLEGGINITGGKAEQGAGIYNDGNVVADNAFIWDNGANQGGGVYNTAGATFTLNGGRIDKNEVAIAGGGIDNQGTVYLNGGAITENTAGHGAGISNSGQVFDANGQLITSSPLVFGNNGENIWK
jgi:hypothetical protein